MLVIMYTSLTTLLELIFNSESLFLQLSNKDIFTACYPGNISLEFCNPSYVESCSLAKCSKNEDLHCWVVKAFLGFVTKLMDEQLEEIHNHQTQQPVELPMTWITLPHSLQDLQLQLQQVSHFSSLRRSPEVWICCFLTFSQVFPIPRPLLT